VTDISVASSVPEIYQDSTYLEIDIRISIPDDAIEFFS
jgi:hypothetical protein